MGRWRGGLTTRIHALVDAIGCPILLKLTEGQAHDGRSAADMFDTVLAGQTLLADRPMTAAGCTRCWPNAARGAISGWCRAGRRASL